MNRGQFGTVSAYNTILFFTFGTVVVSLLLSVYFLNSYLEGNYHKKQRDSLISSLTRSYKESLSSIITSGKHRAQDYLRHSIEKNRIIKDMIVSTMEGEIIASVSKDSSEPLDRARLHTKIKNSAVADLFDAEYYVKNGNAAQLLFVSTIFWDSKRKVKYFLGYTIEDEIYNQIYVVNRSVIGGLIIFLMATSLSVVWVISRRCSASAMFLARKYLLLLHNSPMVLFLQKMDGEMIEYSGNTPDILDIHKTKNFYDLLPSKNEEIKMRSFDKQMIGEMKNGDISVSFNTKEGKRTFRLYKFPIQIESKEIILCGMLVDITEIGVLEDALRQKSEELEQINKKLTEEIVYEINNNRKKEILVLDAAKKFKISSFLKKFAQSWRQPINNIYLLHMGIKEGECRTRECISDVVKKSSDELDRLIFSVLGFDTIFVGSYTLERFEVGEAIDLASEFLRYELRRRSVDVVPKTGYKLKIQGDKNSLTQLFILSIALCLDVIRRSGISSSLIFVKGKKVTKSILVIQLTFALPIELHADVLGNIKSEQNMLHPWSFQYAYLISLSLKSLRSGRFFATSEGGNVILNLEVSLE